MFSHGIIEDGKFYRLPVRAQLLYVHMCMNADDEGFCTRTNLLRRELRTKQSEVEELVKMGYLYAFSDDLYLITHWRQHNRIRKDRGVSSVFTEERKRVFVRPDQAYMVSPEPLEGLESHDFAQANGVHPLWAFIFDRDRQLSDEVENSIEKESIDQERPETGLPAAPVPWTNWGERIL